jgi:hypothetical protein
MRACRSRPGPPTTSHSTATALPIPAERCLCCTHVRKAPAQSRPRPAPPHPTAPRRAPPRPAPPRALARARRTCARGHRYPSAGASWASRRACGRTGGGQSASASSPPSCGARAAAPSWHVCGKGRSGHSRPAARECAAALIKEPLHCIGTAPGVAGAVCCRPGARTALVVRTAAPQHELGAPPRGGRPLRRAAADRVSQPQAVHAQYDTSRFCFLFAPVVMPSTRCIGYSAALSPAPCIVSNQQIAARRRHHCSLRSATHADLHARTAGVCSAQRRGACCPCLPLGE